MNTLRILTVAAFVTAVTVSTASAQSTQVRGTVEKVDGNTLMIKEANGSEAILKLADKAVIVGINKASVSDIKEGSYIGSGALPQPDGTQKAVEVHIFAESQRGTGDGHREGWPGAPGGTMTNGAVGQTVSGVDGPVITVKYRDGEKKIIVGPNVPIRRFEIISASDIKPGAAVNVPAAQKKPDGTYETARINVGRDGVAP
jgi:hypothetical protein